MRRYHYFDRWANAITAYGVLASECVTASSIPNEIGEIKTQLKPLSQ